MEHLPHRSRANSRTLLAWPTCLAVLVNSVRRMPALLVFATLSCAGIATIRPEIPLPPQSIDTPVPAGLARVVFFNGPQGGTTIDGADKVNIIIDGRGLASLRKWQFVQVFLAPGTYEVKLEHLDIGTFGSGHLLDVEAGDNWVKAYSTLTSNRLERIDQQPDRFIEKYRLATGQ